MTEGLEAKKRALLAQLEMVFVFLFTPFYMKKKKNTSGSSFSKVG